MACFYCLLVNRDFSPTVYADFAVFFLFVVSCSVFGYMVNDYADLRLDLAHGKSNAFINASKRQCAFIIAAAIAIIAVAAFIFRERFLLIPLVVTWFFLAAFYSLKPLRFKGRGLIGIIVSTACQFTLPFLMLFSVFRFNSQLDVWLFTLYATAKGAALDIGHQRLDFDRDRSTRTQTYAVTVGFHRVSYIYQLALALERVFLGVIITLMTVRLWGVLEDHRPAVGMGLGLLSLVFLGLIALNRDVVWRVAGVDAQSDPYYGDLRSSLRVLHVVLPTVLMPLVLLLLLILENGWNALILGLFLLWIRPTPSKVAWVLRSPFEPLASGT